jgi:hypothetical protein
MSESDEILSNDNLWSSSDQFEQDARVSITDFFDKNKNRVFYSRQVEVIHEDKYFHWITNRVLRKMAEGGQINTEKRDLKIGTVLTLYWHPSFRYYKREAQKLVDVVDEYSEASIGSALGDHGELLVLQGFAKFGYLIKGLNVNSYNGRNWTVTNHDLDIIMEKDSIAYGVEVKNRLAYIDKEEFDVKIQICDQLQIKPVFVNRMLPRIWIEELRLLGGFALILKYQLYPTLLTEQAKLLREQFFLPVDSPRALMDGTIQRFENWHKKNVK